MPDQAYSLARSRVTTKADDEKHVEDCRSDDGPEADVIVGLISCHALHLV